MAEVWAMLTQPKKGGSGGSGGTSASGVGAGGNGLLKVPAGFGQGDRRRR